MFRGGFHISLAVLALASWPVWADGIWFVDKSNLSGTENGAAWGSAFTTIQPAVDLAEAASGGEVRIAAGVYDEIRLDGDGALVLCDGLILRGGYPPGGGEVPDAAAYETAIDGSQSRGGLPAYKVVRGADCSIEGVTIQGGRGGATGGGLYCSGCSATLSGCIIRDNQAGQGGGISVTYGDFVLQDCLLDGNTATSDTGGGFYLKDGTATITRSRFLNNTAAGMGGGIYAGQNTDTYFGSCLVAGNTAGGQGAGIVTYGYVSSSAPTAATTITGCTIVDNTSGLSPAGVSGWTSSALVVNTILWGNSPGQVSFTGISGVHHCDVENHYYFGSNTIECDPLFVDREQGDYRLQAGSACIDAGREDDATDSDLDGSVRPLGAASDMGAYEFDGIPTGVPGFCEEVDPACGGWVEADAASHWSGRYGHTAVVFQDKMWVLGGTTDFFGAAMNDVWSSPDGVQWERVLEAAPWAVRHGHTSVVFDNKIWILGGMDGSGNEAWLNDVWYSEDGANWTQATPHADWKQRKGHTSVVHNGCIWVLGGHNRTVSDYVITDSYLKDVWYSYDGVDWFVATSSAAWGGREEHSSVVYDGKMWVIGGVNLNDAWYSTEGSSWTRATQDAPWYRLRRHSSVVFDGAMYVLGGSGVSEVDTVKDIWRSLNGVTWEAVQCPPPGQTAAISRPSFSPSGCGSSADSRSASARTMTT